MARERMEERWKRRRVVKLLATVALFLVETKKKTRGKKNGGGGRGRRLGSDPEGEGRDWSLSKKKKVEHASCVTASREMTKRNQDGVRRLLASIDCPDWLLSSFLLISSSISCSIFLLLFLGKQERFGENADRFQDFINNIISK
jgi:hypothetical protein